MNARHIPTAHAGMIAPRRATSGTSIVKVRPRLVRDVVQDGRMAGPKTVNRHGPGLTDIMIVLVGVAIAVAAVAPIVVHWLTNPPDQRLVDLDVYRSGGQVVLRGAPVYKLLT